MMTMYQVVFTTYISLSINLSPLYLAIEPLECLRVLSH